MEFQLQIPVRALVSLRGGALIPAALLGQRLRGVAIYVSTTTDTLSIFSAGSMGVHNHKLPPLAVLLTVRSLADSAAKKTVQDTKLSTILV
jgi:hypothetical protein